MFAYITDRFYRLLPATTKSVIFYKSAINSWLRRLTVSVPAAVLISEESTVKIDAGSVVPDVPQRPATYRGREFRRRCLRAENSEKNEARF